MPATTTTIATLKSQLIAKGYAAAAATQQGAILVTIYVHPLIASPIVLMGHDGEFALEYQVALVQQAVRRR